MDYHSTRDKSHRVSALEAILRGIAPDGGLYVPASFPKLPPLDTLVGRSYGAVALEILRGYLPEMDSGALKAAVEEAYGRAKFPGTAPVVLRETGDAFFLELFHGPTLAFKDMALCLLPHLLREAMERMNLKEEVVILTATSGDTGKAALEGFKDVPGVKVVVFYPEEGVSAIQKRQMVTQEGDNTVVVALQGNFDDAQSGVKAIFQDPALAAVLKERGFFLSSANSINIGRLLPQIIYHVYGYLKLLEWGKIREGEAVTYTVPTGNFGNILAAHYARNMGLPMKALQCASNANHVLSDFLATGVYNRDRPLLRTSSPSMDILVSSNLERYLHGMAAGEDGEAWIRVLMEALNTQGTFQVSKTLLRRMQGGFAGEEETAAAIRKVYERDGYAMDPHTAVAYAVNQKLRVPGDPGKHIIVATASPYKFPEKILTALGEAPPADAFAGIRRLSALLGEAPPEALVRAFTLPLRHRDVIGKAEMKDAVLRILKGGDSHG